MTQLAIVLKKFKPQLVGWAIIVLGVAVAVFTALAPFEAHAYEGEVTYEGSDTALSGDDTGNNPFPIGFTFTYFGVDYTQFGANTNGVLFLGSTSDSDYSNSCLNSSDAASNAIFPFWDDLTVYSSNNSKVLYKTIGDAPNRQLVVQWTGVYFYGTDVQMGTFMTILHEGSNDIQIQYRDLLGGDRALGNSATIGIKKDNSTYYQHGCNTTDAITSEQAIRYDYGGGDTYTVDTEATYNPVYLVEAGAPETPVLTAPANTAADQALQPTLDWEPADNATSYSLLVSTQSSFSSTVVNETGVTDTEYTIDSDLEYDTTYYWRVQAVNNVGGALSGSYSFITIENPDKDSDGILNSVEDNAPNNGDGNGDGTDDSDQVNVTSIPNSVAGDSAYGTIVSNTCSTFVSASFDNEATHGDDSEYDYPVGLASFALTCDNPGDTAEITIYYDQNYDTSDWVARKFVDGAFIPVEDAVFSTADVGGNTVTTLSYSVVVGGPLDADGAEDGTVTDPAGPAVVAAADNDAQDEDGDVLPAQTTDSDNDAETTDTLASTGVSVNAVALLAVSLVSGGIYLVSHSRAESV